ncbi:MAG: phosphoribosylformylglycinamidine synthase subunit PurL [Planctomycetota bacterium]|nr:MAG: phosphoribosylformylglycinamidine synthase subunit PurL [Planctomycetota bacterium]
MNTRTKTPDVTVWEVEVRPTKGEIDREAERVLAESRNMGLRSVRRVMSARSFLLEGRLDAPAVQRAAEELLADPVVESYRVRCAAETAQDEPVPEGLRLLNVLFHPGVTDNVGESTRRALVDLGFEVGAAATARKYWINDDISDRDFARLCRRVLANEAIEHIVIGPLHLHRLHVGGEYRFQKIVVPLRDAEDETLLRISREGGLSLNLQEMHTIRDHFREVGREPTDIELETIAQTWSEHCSHKTLTGPVVYRDEHGEQRFENLLKETIFAATQTLRRQWGRRDWCVSVFRDNAGVVRFNERYDVCFKVETHNHPSAIEPYGGANTGIGGVIRDPLGTGLGAKPVCNTDVFCFAPPTFPDEQLPPGVLPPRAVIRGVVAGVRDYGNRMGIPTVNGAVYFDDRYLGNPLVYCGNVALLPVGKHEKRVEPGDLIVVVGGRTGRDGIHGATFSSVELTEESETASGGAVQIGNAITEKMLLEVLLQARDRGLYHAITDCGAGGFSSAVGEMGAETGAEVWLEKAPLKYSGLSYTEIWISEAQERMVLALPPENWDAFRRLCEAEGVEAAVIGRFTNTRRLALFYDGRQVGDLSMDFLHHGRPRIVREACYRPPATRPLVPATTTDWGPTLKRILGSWNVCSKEWIIRQYDHEVQAGSVVKPLVGRTEDGPGDAAVLRPDLQSRRGIAVACGMNPLYGDLDPYWMAASAIDEAVRNCVAVGADPERIAILDNFCWGNTERPETLGSLVRAATACRDIALAYGTPFISGKDSLYNEFSYQRPDGSRETVVIPGSLLISALGQIEDVDRAVTMDLKRPGNRLLLVGETADELGGTHFALVTGASGGRVPRVRAKLARRIFASTHHAIRDGLVAACHDLSEGGLAAAAAEMAFAGAIGAELDLTPLAEATGLRNEATLLFSESNSRFLLEVAPENLHAVRERFADLPVVELGQTTDAGRLRIRGLRQTWIVDESLDELKNAWQQPLDW